MAINPSDPSVTSQIQRPRSKFSKRNLAATNRDCANYGISSGTYPIPRLASPNLLYIQTFSTESRNIGSFHSSMSHIPLPRAPQPGLHPHRSVLHRTDLRPFLPLQNPSSLHMLTLIQPRKYQRQRRRFPNMMMSRLDHDENLKHSGSSHHKDRIDHPPPHHEHVRFRSGHDTWCRPIAYSRRGANVICQDICDI